MPTSNSGDDDDDDVFFFVNRFVLISRARRPKQTVNNLWLPSDVTGILFISRGGDEVCFGLRRQSKTT